jgi:hypothetical protein
MTLHTTLAIWAFIAVMTLFTLALVLWQAGDDAEERKAVPVKGAVVMLVSGLVLALGAGMATSNIAGVAAGEKARAERAFIQINSGYALTGTPDSPAGDILAGDNPMDDPSRIHDLAAGKVVALRTGSGQSATVQLFSTGTGVLPVVTYDGKEQKELTAPFQDSAGGSSGFPQIIPLPELPRRE